VRSAAARPARFDRANQHRRALLAKVHLAKKELGLQEDDYRAILLRVTSRTSAGECSEAELARVVEELKAKGFRPKPATGRKPGVAGRRAAPGRVAAADHPVARKARALWISLHQLGAIENASEQALEAFARRQLGVERMQWMNQALGYRLVEALKAIAERHGWAQGVNGATPAGRLIILKQRLCEAILAKLKAAELAGADWTLEEAAFRLLGFESARGAMFWELPDLDLVAAGLGAKLRGDNHD
jgi:phage gp16-like protein